MKKVTKAIIPAAGLGTRMLPISRAVPKEMLPIMDYPAIYYLVKEAADSGITDVLIITGRDKTPMEEFFDYSPEYDAALAKKGRDAERDALHAAREEFHRRRAVCRAVRRRHHLQPKAGHPPADGHL